MALLSNGFRETLTGVMFGNTLLNGTTPAVHEYRRHMAARMRNQSISEGITSQLASVPSGARHPVAWVMAQKNGALSSRNEAVLSFTPTASGALGLPAEGTADFTIDFATATGGLISSGTGEATITFTVDGTILATRSGDGTAAISFTTNTPLLGALGWVTGDGPFSVNGTLASYANGFMVGSTVDTSTIVNANIVSVNGYAVTGNGQSGTEWGPA